MGSYSRAEANPPNLTRPTFRSIDRFFDFLSEKKHSDRNSLPRGVVPRPKRRGGAARDQGWDLCRALIPSTVRCRAPKPPCRLRAPGEQVAASRASASYPFFYRSRPPKL